MLRRQRFCASSFLAHALLAGILETALYLTRFKNYSMTSHVTNCSGEVLGAPASQKAHEAPPRLQLSVRARVWAISGRTSTTQALSLDKPNILFKLRAPAAPGATLPSSSLLASPACAAAGSSGTNVSHEPPAATSSSELSLLISMSGCRVPSAAVNHCAVRGAASMVARNGFPKRGLHAVVCMLA